MATAPSRTARRRVSTITRSDLRAQVMALCERKLDALHLLPLVVRHPRDAKDERIAALAKKAYRTELDAREALSRAHQALRALLVAVPSNVSCGPCTQHVQAHRDRIEAIEREVFASRPARWRQHSYERLSPNASPTAWTVEMYSRRRMTIGGRTRGLSMRELAMISLVYGAALRGDTVNACIEAETRSVRADVKRRREAENSDARRR